MNVTSLSRCATGITKRMTTSRWKTLKNQRRNELDEKRNKKHGEILFTYKI